MRTSILSIAALSFLAASFAAAAPAAIAAPVKQAAEGGACHVVSGANKGKSGTYDADGDCAGSWGMSECKNQDGTDSGKCADGKARTVRQPVVARPLGAAVLNRAF